MDNATNQTPLYYSSFDDDWNLLHVYKDSGNESIIHINVTEPLINILNRREFNRALRILRAEPITSEEFNKHRNRVLAIMDLI